MEACGGGGGNPGGPSGGGNVPQLTQVTGTTSGNTVTVNVDAASPLNSVGGAALVQSGNSSFLAARTAQDTINVFTSICTHEQCNVTGFSSGTFVCPCHGSQYNTSGAVVQGPATQRLRQFNSQLTNNVLTFTL
jgi:cytochrome b6-f complex iron-sulfur subunit